MQIEMQIEMEKQHSKWIFQLFIATLVAWWNWLSTGGEIAALLVDLIQTIQSTLDQTPIFHEVLRNQWAVDSGKH